MTMKSSQPHRWPAEELDQPTVRMRTPIVRQPSAAHIEDHGSTHHGVPFGRALKDAAELGAFGDDIDEL
jgi:hypothetical protein